MKNVTQRAQFARKNDIVFFASEKFKIIFPKLSQKVYMKVKSLVEKNTSVGPYINFFVVEFFI